MDFSATKGSEKVAVIFLWLLILWIGIKNYLEKV